MDVYLIKNLVHVPCPVISINRHPPPPKHQHHPPTTTVSHLPLSSPIPVHSTAATQQRCPSHPPPNPTPINRNQLNTNWPPITPTTHARRLPPTPRFRSPQ
ncbi:hypothetical protein E2C01_000239 [Portunus trituberculatus]|uniref:Uncharacterized protein n=1 Tax=Portunus trituberculatus TaxID=210409 RepID=A0A5B7CG43_PORTR|nr:hypothetical protein [Portunus trituberculatus]